MRLEAVILIGRVVEARETRVLGKVCFVRYRFLSRGFFGYRERYFE